MAEIAEIAYVFVSSDFKYFKISAQDCCRSPCIDISRFTSHMNIVSSPFYFITSLNGSTIALSLTVANIPFEFIIKSYDETLQIFQNVVVLEDALKIAENVTNIYLYQTLHAFYARVFEEKTREIVTLTNKLQEQQQNQDIVSISTINNYIVDV